MNSRSEVDRRMELGFGFDPRQVLVHPLFRGKSGKTFKEIHNLPIRSRQLYQRLLIRFAGTNADSTHHSLEIH
jgi:hypothetical protein